MQFPGLAQPDQSRALRHHSDPQGAPHQNRESVEQIRPVLFDGRYCIGSVLASLIQRSNQQYARMRFPVAEDQFSEIFVSGQQQRLFLARDPEHLCILNARRGLSNEKHPMTSGSKRGHGGTFDTFVRHNSQDATRSRG